MKRWKNEKKRCIHISYEKNLNNIFSSFFEWIPILTLRILLCGSFSVGDLILDFLLLDVYCMRVLYGRLFSYRFDILIRIGQRIMQTCPTSRATPSKWEWTQHSNHFWIAKIKWANLNIKLICASWIRFSVLAALVSQRKTSILFLSLDHLLPFESHHSRYGTSSNLDYSRCNK